MRAKAAIVVPFGAPTARPGPGAVCHSCEARNPADGEPYELPALAALGTNAAGLRRPVQRPTVPLSTPPENSIRRWGNRRLSSFRRRQSDRTPAAPPGTALSSRLWPCHRRKHHQTQTPHWVPACAGTTGWTAGARSPHSVPGRRAGRSDAGATAKPAHPSPARHSGEGRNQIAPGYEQTCALRARPRESSRLWPCHPSEPMHPLNRCVPAFAGTTGWGTDQAWRRPTRSSFRRRPESRLNQCACGPPVVEPFVYLHRRRASTSNAHWVPACAGTTAWGTDQAGGTSTRSSFRRGRSDRRLDMNRRALRARRVVEPFVALPPSSVHPSSNAAGYRPAPVR